MDCILIGIDTLMNDGPRLTGADCDIVCGGYTCPRLMIFNQLVKNTLGVTI